MELLVLDKDFRELGTVELFSSLQWTRRYYEVGDFELHCSKEFFQLFDEGVYLFRKGYELALIDHVEIERSYTGEVTLKVAGQFVEALLNDRALTGKQSKTGTQEDIARALVNENFINPTDTKRKCLKWKLAPKNNLGTSMTLSYENDYVGDVTYAMLKEKEYSQSLIYNYLDDTLNYVVWQGKDRTDAQSVNSQAVFSDNLENVLDDTYSKDLKEYKNFCYVVGKDNIVVSVDKVGTDHRRRELVVSDSDADRNILTNEGNMQLGKNKVVEIFDGRISTDANFLYRQDWDLGDLCTFNNTRIGKIANKRITEIREVYEEGNVEIYPKFGDDYITINQKIKREVSR